MSDVKDEHSNKEAEHLPWKRGKCILLWLPVNGTEWQQHEWSSLRRLLPPFFHKKKQKKNKKENQLITDRQYTASHWQANKCIYSDLKVCFWNEPWQGSPDRLVLLALITSVLYRIAPDMLKPFHKPGNAPKVTLFRGSSSLFALPFLLLFTKWCSSGKSHSRNVIQTWFNATLRLLHCSNSKITHLFIVNICLADCGRSVFFCFFLTSESLESRLWISTDWFLSSFGLFILGPLNVMRLLQSLCNTQMVVVYLPQHTVPTMHLCLSPVWITQASTKTDGKQGDHFFLFLPQQKAESGDSFSAQWKAQPAEVKTEMLQA